MKAAGPVFTVRGRPDPALDNHTSPFEWAGLLSRVPDGHVVMCQPQDDRRTPFGGLSAEALKLERVRGCIVDDGCRDIRAAVDQGFPVFASYAAPIDIVCAKRAQAFKQPVASRSQAARRRRRGAGGEAQARRLGQHMKGSLARAGGGAGVGRHLRHALHRAAPCCFEKTALFGPGLDAVHDFRSRRQVGQHLSLGLAQQERRRQPAQAAARGIVVLALNGVGWCWRGVGMAFAWRSLNCRLLPNRPGLSKFMIDRRSTSRFSTCLPVSARRNAAGRVAIASTRSVTAFFSACASFSTKVTQGGSGPRAAKVSMSICFRA